MEENQFGFEYSWADLQPIRTLMIVLISFQVVGSLLGLWIAHYSEWFSNLWAGGAIATFPGYVVETTAAAPLSSAVRVRRR